MTGVRISGDIKLTSVLASGLPTSEDLEHVNDLDALKVVPLLPHQSLDLFIGVFSTANNFKRRMSVRRTWMQYPAVKSGAVAVRFFVGLVSAILSFHYYFVKYCRSALNIHVNLIYLFLLNFLPFCRYTKCLHYILQHKNQIVNEELWSEMKTYGDIQLMPFVDYYGLITWKTVAICIFGVNSYSHSLFFFPDSFSLLGLFCVFNRQKLFQPSLS